jgi:hypothetical protein
VKYNRTITAAGKRRPATNLLQVAVAAAAIKLAFPREMLINSANEMKHEAHGTQQPRHINKIGKDASTAQRSDSLV